MRVLDLFSGIGGFSLGLERTGGFETVAFCEIDKAAQAVLKKHWPNVPIFENVSKLSAKDIDGPIDVICGGFPCQDISTAGKGAGLAGERSGLWFQFHRLIKEIRPKYALIENVSALRSRGLDEVLRSLAEIGYDAEWHCIPASAVGAPHRRDRAWILAYPCGTGSQGPILNGDAFPVTNFPKQSFLGDLEFHAGVQWGEPSSYLRVGNGLPCEPHRLKQLGNAVVPQIPELIGKAILEGMYD